MTKTAETETKLTMLAVGDVLPNRENPDSMFALVAPKLRQADIAFCQLEASFSERGTLLPQVRVPSRAHPRNAPALKNAGFNIVSFASNKCMDYGEAALLDTLDNLHKLGIAVAGAGKNIEDARKPVIVEKKGTKVAFLAYSSILPPGFWALPDRAGCAPLRGVTLYEQVEVDQPGTPARVYSFLLPEDLEAMEADIKRIRQTADVVVVSHHCGIHFVPAKLAMYQRQAAHAAIDAGADIVLQHHSHILKGIEVYKGKVIFYGLCNFAIDLTIPDSAWESFRFKELRELNPNWEREPGSTYQLPADSRKTIVVKVLISGKQIERVAYLPTMINKNSQPEIVPRTDKRAREIYDYVEWACRDQNIPTRFSWKEDEVIIET